MSGLSSDTQAVCVWVTVSYFLTLVPGSSLAVHAVGQIRAITEHPTLAGGSLVRSGCSECTVPACPSTCELSWEVDGEGAEATVWVLMGVCGTPGGFLLDEGVWAQWTVGGTSMEIQHGCPLRGTANRQRAVPIPRWQGRHWRQEGVEVAYVWAHGGWLTRLGEQLQNGKTRNESEFRIRGELWVKKSSPVKFHSWDLKLRDMNVSMNTASMSMRFLLK